jgi:HEPN domain-containing protein
MKKIIITIMFLSVAIIAFASSQAEQLAMKSLYSITTNDYSSVLS